MPCFILNNIWYLYGIHHARWYMSWFIPYDGIYHMMVYIPYTMYMMYTHIHVHTICIMMQVVYIPGIIPYMCICIFIYM
jgi:hypothetical protein